VVTTPSAPGELERRLRTLREEQAGLAASGQGDSATMRRLATDIASVAVRLGFDVEEAAAIASRIDAPALGSGSFMAGEYRVLRGAVEPILTFSVLVLAGAVIGLGQPLAGGVIIVAAAASWVIHGARRVARLRIDPSGAPEFPGRLESFAPSELISVDFAYRYPPFVAEHQKAASETVDLRLRLTGNRSIRLARGALWRMSPVRGPVAYHQLERSLLAWAHDAGLTIEPIDTGWSARRS